MSRRAWSLGLTVFVLGAFFGLLGWAMVRSEGVPGGLGINKDFGEITVEHWAAPDFTLELLDGSVVQLSDLQGKVVMLDFWSSWCAPCRDEAPGLARVYNEFRGAPVEFVGISIWDKATDARIFTDTFGVTYPNGVDNGGNILVDYAVRGIPEKFFIDVNGQIVRKFIGPASEARLAEILNELLANAS